MNESGERDAVDSESDPTIKLSNDSGSVPSADESPPSRTEGRPETDEATVPPRDSVSEHDATLPPRHSVSEHDATLPPREATDASEHDATLPPTKDFDAAMGDATLPPRDSVSEHDATLPPHSTPFGGGDDTESPNSAGGTKPRAPGQAEIATLDGDVASGHDRKAGSLRTFGDYELLHELARGGMGVVYKARQKKLNRIVALKMILTGQLASQDEVLRFYTEAEAAANLDHAGIVPIYEVGQHDGQHFFSMGYIEGESLADKVKEGPLPPREAAEVTQQVAEAIAYAHQQGVIHRDLKPANVLLKSSRESRAASREQPVSSSASQLSTLDFQPMVTDFGLAKQVEGDSGLTATGQILGTPGFMPPEQAAGETDKIGPAADIYSLGAILYNLLTGRAPFQSASVMDTLVAVLEQEPVAPRQLNAALDQDLETICLKCLEKDPSRRYQTAEDLVNELGRYLKGEPINARPISTTVRVWRWCRRNRLATVTMSATLLLCLISGLWGIEQYREKRLASVQVLLDEGRFALDAHDFKYAKDRFEKARSNAILSEFAELAVEAEALFASAEERRIDEIVANQQLATAEIATLLAKDDVAGALIRMHEVEESLENLEHTAATELREEVQRLLELMDVSVDTDEALQQLTKYFDSDPELALRKLTSAIRLSGISPSSSFLRGRRGWMLLTKNARLGHHDFDVIIKSGSASAIWDAYCGRGYAHARLGQIDAAIDDAEKALRTVPEHKHQDALYNVACIYTESVASLRRLPAKARDPRELHLQLKAMELIRQFLGQFPGHEKQILSRLVIPDAAMDSIRQSEEFQNLLAKYDLN